MRKTFYPIPFLFVVLSSFNAMAENFELVDRYISSYSQFDLEQLENFYSEDAEFKDLTTENYGKHAFIMEGKQNILDKFKATTAGKLQLNYRIIDQYEASGHHVLISEVTTRSGKKPNFSCGKVVSIIKVKNDKIVSHIDYADYKHFNQSAQNKNNQCKRF